VQSRAGWLLLLPLIISTTYARAAGIPDSSVLPAWSETLTTVVDLAKRDFPGFTAAARRSGPVTDSELVNGVRLASPQQAPSLEGADECFVEREQHARYLCRFFETGTADVGRDEYVRLVRLIEKAAHGTVPVRAGNPVVTNTDAFESRSATVEVAGLKSGITVEELFSRGKPITFEVRLEGQEALAPAVLTEAPLPDLNAFQIIAAAVRIEQSPHTDLRSPESGSGSGPVTMENESAARIAVYLSGPSTQRVLIAPHGSAKVKASPGTYKVAAEATDGSATPLFAVQSYAGGERVRFYSAAK